MQQRDPGPRQEARRHARAGHGGRGGAGGGAGEPLKVALLSPFHGGSHRAWAEGWRVHSAHRLEILSLPGRFWRWRMDAAAVHLARRLGEIEPPDVIVATDMMDLAAFLGLTRGATGDTPALLYMHENQFTYPLPEGPDGEAPAGAARAYRMVNFTSMLAADRVAFNSEFHRRELLTALPPFLSRAPDHPETARVAELESRSDVLPVGVEVGDLPHPESGPPDPARPPLVLWNQRWEYDKDPAALMRVLCALHEQGERFEVALCGQQEGRVPSELAEGIERLGKRVVQAGFLPRREYTELLGRATVVVSTARHEFFGIAVVEAIAAGAMPLLPDRLSYPEVLPERWHADCLYADESDLRDRLRAALREPAATRARGAEMAERMRRRYGWESVAPACDTWVEEAASAIATGGRA